MKSVLTLVDDEDNGVMAERLVECHIEQVVGPTPHIHHHPLCSKWCCHKQLNLKVDEEILRNGKVRANVKFS